MQQFPEATLTGPLVAAGSRHGDHPNLARKEHASSRGASVEVTGQNQ